MDEEVKSETIETKAPKNRMHVILIAIIAVLVIALVAVLLTTIQPSSMSSKPQVMTVTTSSLTKILNISELSTMKYTYNSVVKAVDSEGAVKYYVAYMGTVRAGIDFAKITEGLSIDEESKTVTIVLPEIQVHDAIVDISSLDYLFYNKKYERMPETAAEAYALCEKDLQNAGKNSELLSAARDNAISTIRAILNPWVEGFSIEFN